MSFGAMNAAICRRYFQPRLYTTTHMTAVSCWFQNQVQPPHADAEMLEFGCGREFPLSRLLGGRFGRSSATDIDAVDPDLRPRGVEFRQCSETELPFADAQFDVIAVRSVLEHVAEPRVTFRELSRVLKPGGRIYLNLPNKWDYVSVAARISGPIKSRLLRGLLDTTWDDFPVHYRCNTKRALRRAITDTGLELQFFSPLPSEPTYLRFFVPLYLAGAVYQFAIGLLGLDFLQPAFLVILRKKG